MTTILQVSTRDDLMAALTRAKGGETILLAGGDYGPLGMGLKSGLPIVFPDTVTIASADPNDPAVFSRLNLSRGGNLVLDGLVFDYTFDPADSIKVRPFEVAGFDITIRNSVFRGDVADGVSDTADGFGWGMGLGVRGATRFTLENSEISGFHRGLVVGQSQDVRIIGNNVHDIRSDGMNFAQVQGVVIERNHLHDFSVSTGSGDHRDMIQFWTASTRAPSTDIVIRDNILDIGAGGSTQSIFMRNEMVDRRQAGPEMNYRNVVIEGNTIYNAHLHGIHLGETSGAIIRNNVVLFANPDLPPGSAPAAVNVPRINVAASSTDVTITGNITSTVGGWSGQAGWTVADNSLVQPGNPRGPGFYGDVFVGSSLTLGEDGHAYRILPGGALDTGAAVPGSLKPGAALDAMFHITRDPDNAAFRILDATQSRLDGRPVPEGATYHWTFADGTTATGAVVRQPFPEAGQQAVTLTVRLPDGRSADERAEIAVAGHNIVTLGAEGFVAEAFGADRLMTPVEGGVLTLGPLGSTATVGRSALREMFEADSFEIGLTLAAARPGTSGEVFRLHGSFIATVNTQGELVLRVFTEGREARVTTSGANLADTAPHDIRIQLADGRLSVTVDGAELGATALPAPIAYPGNHGLTFGNVWNTTSFAGTLSAFEIDVHRADYVAAAEVAQALALAQRKAPAPEPVLPEPIVTEPTVTEPAPPQTDAADDDAAAPQPVPPPAETPAPLQMPKLDGFVLDLAALAAGTAPRQQSLAADAVVVERPNGLALRLDGKDDYLALGRLTAFEKSDRIGFSVSFTPDADGPAGPQRLVWNHTKIGATVSGDLVVVQVATAHEGFKSFAVRDARITAGEESRLTVLLDAAEDRLQVLIDDRVALDHRGTDFDFVGAGGREWGWMIGTPWNRHFAGEVSDFRLGDRFDFLDLAPGEPWAA